MDKLTWKNVYEDFRRRFPNLKKNVSCWRPYYYATICLYTKDNKRMLYNYDTRDIKFLDD